MRMSYSSSVGFSKIELVSAKRPLGIVSNHIVTLASNTARSSCVGQTKSQTTGNPAATHLSASTRIRFA